MLVNSSLTIYHKDFDEEKRIEKWIRFNYGSEKESKVWFYGGKGSSMNKGYENVNDVKIRIPYDINQNLDISNFNIGDILVQGNLNFDIMTLKDLQDHDIYNITSITNNTFGPNRHIYLGGK